MKTAIYIEDGTVQLVITPQTDFEKNALSTFEEHELGAKIYSGSFYDCRGGWVRQAEHNAYREFNKDDKSLMIRIKTNDPEQAVKVEEG